MYGSSMISLIPKTTRMDFDKVFNDTMGDKVRKRTHAFQISRSSKRSKVNAVTEPTIMSIKGKFVVEPTLLVAQTNFFNRNNQQKEYAHVSPWHYPFVQSLLQRTPLPNFDMNKFEHVGRYRDSIEPVTRSYEETFLTEAVGDQRCCINEESCEGLNICQEGFVLREFLLPTQQKLYESTKRYPLNREPCLMCRRLRIAKTVIATRAAGNGLKHDYLVQDYYNFVDMEGEYRLEDCLLSKQNTWEGLCNPVVLHQRNNYRFHMDNKVRTYKQWRYPYYRPSPCQKLGETPSNTTPF